MPVSRIRVRSQEGADMDPNRIYEERVSGSLPYYRMKVQYTCWSRQPTCLSLPKCQHPSEQHHREELPQSQTGAAPRLARGLDSLHALYL